MMEYKEDGGSVDLKLPVKHVLSRELQVLLALVARSASFLFYHQAPYSKTSLIVVQLYYEKITDLAVTRSNSVLLKEALVSLATDSGLHPLVPYFTFFIADEVIFISFQFILSLMLEL